MPQMVFPHFLSLRISSHRLSGSTESNSRSHFTMRNGFLMGNSIHVLITTTITSESDQRCLESRWMCAGVGVYASPCGRKHSGERHWCKNQLVRLWTWPCLSWLFEKTETFHMFTVCGFHFSSELNTTWETGWVVKSGFGFTPVQHSMLLRVLENNDHIRWLGKCQQQWQ